MELDRQNGVVTDAPDGAAQQAADERERTLREEDELLGERARQRWQDANLWTVVAAASEGGRTHAEAPVVMTLRLIESNEALKAELATSRESSERLAHEQSGQLAKLIQSNEDLKTELVKSRQSAERLAKWTIGWTIALTALTIALVVLTVILVNRADVPGPAVHAPPTATANSPSHAPSRHTSPNHVGTTSSARATSR